jgi:hypothetical protein
MLASTFGWPTDSARAVHPAVANTPQGSADRRLREQSNRHYAGLYSSKATELRFDRVPDGEYPLRVIRIRPALELAGPGAVE